MKKRIISFFNKHYIFFLNIYLISIFLKSSSLIIDYPMIRIVERILRVIALLLMLIRVVVIIPELKKIVLNFKWENSDIKEKVLFITLILLIVGIIVNTIKIKSIRLLSIALVILSAYNINLEKILKNILNMQLLMTTIIITSSIIGVTQDYTISRINQSVVRHALGFSYTTNLSQIIFFTSLTYIFLKKFKASFSEIFILQIINIYTYYLTDSKTEILGFELLVLMCLIIKLKFIKKLIPKISRIITKVFILVPILSLTLVMIYPMGGFMKVINKALSGRLSIQCEVISEGNIKLFGSNIMMVGYGLEDSLSHDTTKEYNYIDNDYIQVLVINGVITASAIVTILYLLILELDKRKQYKKVIYIYIYLLFGILNPRVIELMYSPVLFFIIPTLINKENEGVKNVEL